MPQQDKTGPQGMGPKTGRGFGPCGPGMGMGFGRGRGFGRGLGRYFGWNCPLSKQDKVEDIKNYQKALQEEMEDVNKELKDLETQE